MVNFEYSETSTMTSKSQYVKMFSIRAVLLKILNVVNPLIRLINKIAVQHKIEGVL